MLSKANCRNYVSNQRVFEWDKWRYNRTEGKPTHVFLDYRIVLNYYGAIERGYSGDYSISERAADYIRDLLTISYNLGFKGNTGDGRLWRYSREKIWAPGSPQEFYGIYKGKREIIVEVKCHLNGNLHIRMNQKLALALNVEYGRIKGWIHSKQDAEKELNDSDAGEYFKTNFTLLTSSIPFMIENKTEPTEETPTEESGEGLEQISMF
jgi:hypothetical protein